MSGQYCRKKSVVLGQCVFNGESGKWKIELVEE